MVGRNGPEALDKLSNLLNQANHRREALVNAYLAYSGQRTRDTKTAFMEAASALTPFDQARLQMDNMAQIAFGAYAEERSGKNPNDKSSTSKVLVGPTSIGIFQNRFTLTALSVPRSRQSCNIAISEENGRPHFFSVLPAGTPPILIDDGSLQLTLEDADSMKTTCRIHIIFNKGSIHKSH
jgi:hypothetical protein